MQAKPAKWWGWGFEDRSVPLDARPALQAYLRKVLKVPKGDTLPRPSLDSLVVPPPRLSESDLAFFHSVTDEERLSSTRIERIAHAMGKSYRDLVRLRLGEVPTPPDLVVFPETDEEIRAILEHCSERGIGVIPFGGGTSVVGGVEVSNESRPHIALDLRGMRRVLAVDEVSRLAIAQAGIRGPLLEEALNRLGLTSGHVPQSFEFSTLGGWIAARAAGALSNRYGNIEDIVAGVRLIAPTGVIDVHNRPRQAMGPDLLSLVVGSEGTLGVISQATIRVHRVPEVRAFRSFLFRTFAEGLDAIRGMAQDGVLPPMAYLLDEDETRLAIAAAGGTTGRGPPQALGIRVLRWRGFSFEQGSLLLLGYEGRHDVVRRDRKLARTRVGSAAFAGSSPARLWAEDRFDSPYLRDSLIDHRLMVDVVETATVWSNIERLYEAVRKAIFNAIWSSGVFGVVGCHVSHVYSEGASLYFTWIAPQRRGEELAQFEAVKTAAMRAFLETGGHLSHHHGIGLDHARYLREAIGPDVVRLLEDLKKMLDPNGIMNPGKLVPVSG